MEVGFNLALRTFDGGIWTGCPALPKGLRRLSACSGLGTDTVSVTVGSGEISTGLAPNRLAVLESLTPPGSELRRVDQRAVLPRDLRGVPVRLVHQLLYLGAGQPARIHVRADLRPT